jgi:hypothetical protein
MNAVLGLTALDCTPKAVMTPVRSTFSVPRGAPAPVPPALSTAGFLPRSRQFESACRERSGTGGGGRRSLDLQSFDETQDFWRHP